MKRTIQVFALIIIGIILFHNSVVLANVVKIGETKYIERGNNGDYILQYWNNNMGKWMYIVYSQTYYTDDNGAKRIAYCTTPDADGVGWLPGEYEGYDTTVQYKLSNNNEKDKKLWRVFKNGYPYVSASQLGVESDDDAYIATKQAAYFIIRGRSENEVYNFYRASEDNSDYKRRGQKVIDAIYKLVNIGNNGTDTINSIKINKIGEITKYGDKSFQKYSISNNNCEEKVEIIGIKNAPEGTYIGDDKENEKKTFNAGDDLYVYFDNENINKDYQIEINYKSTCKNYPIFYAKSSIEGTQDYLLSVEKYDDEYGKINLNIDSKKCNFELIKIDEESNKTIEGVTFNIKYKNGQEIGSYTTDADGKIQIDGLRPEEIIVTETSAPDEYILNNVEREIKLIYNETAVIEIYNKLAKPKIEIKKDGPDTAAPGEEIKYDFDISNIGNVGLEEFTWYDFLPYEKSKITKIATGTYNQNLEYNVYYKTDKNNDYILLKEKLNSNANNFIDLSNINLKQEENIIEIKFEFGDVDKGFKTMEKPRFYLQIKDNVSNDDNITNNTKLEGKYKNSKLISEDSTKLTVVKDLIINKKLPRTGF